MLLVPGSHPENHCPETFIPNSHQRLKCSVIEGVKGHFSYINSVFVSPNIGSPVSNCRSYGRGFLPVARAKPGGYLGGGGMREGNSK